MNINTLKPFAHLLRLFQVWDNDKFSADDFLGTVELNLSHMPAPVKKSRQCSLDQLPAFGDSPKMINLFECHRAYGYWPCYNDETGKAELTVSSKLRHLNGT